jgi:hypothetical protein
MSTSPRHCDPGCACEECLTSRISLTAELAADGRDLTGLRTRLDGSMVRIAAPGEARRLRSVS